MSVQQCYCNVPSVDPLFEDRYKRVTGSASSKSKQAAGGRVAMFK